MATFPGDGRDHGRDLRGGRVTPDNGFISTIIGSSAVSEHRDESHPPASGQERVTSSSKLEACPILRLNAGPAWLLPWEGQTQPGLRAPAGPMRWGLDPEGLG